MALRAEFRETLRQRSDGLCYFGGERSASSSATFTLPPPPAGTTRAQWDERLRYFGTRPQYTAEVAKHIDAWALVQPCGLASLYTLAGGDCLLCAAMQCMLGTADAPPVPPLVSAAAPTATAALGIETAPAAAQARGAALQRLGALRCAIYRSLLDCDALRQSLGWCSRAHPEIVAAGTPRRSLVTEHVWVCCALLLFAHSFVCSLSFVLLYSILFKDFCLLILFFVALFFLYL